MGRAGQSNEPSATLEAKERIRSAGRVYFVRTLEEGRSRVDGPGGGQRIYRMNRIF